jgi:hypothetical protein
MPHIVCRLLYFTAVLAVFEILVSKEKSDNDAAEDEKRLHENAPYEKAKPIAGRLQALYGTFASPGE